MAGAAELSQTEPGYWVAAGPEGVGGVNCRTHWDWNKQWLNPRSEEQKKISANCWRACASEDSPPHLSCLAGLSATAGKAREGRRGIVPPKMLIPVPLLGRQQPLLLWALTQPHSPLIWGFHLALNLSRTSSWKQPCQLGRCEVTETCFSLYPLLVPSLKSSALEPSALNPEGCGEGGDSLFCLVAVSQQQRSHRTYTHSPVEFPSALPTADTEPGLGAL